MQRRGMIFQNKLQMIPFVCMQMRLTERIGCHVGHTIRTEPSMQAKKIQNTAHFRRYFSLRSKNEEWLNVWCTRTKANDLRRRETKHIKYAFVRSNFRHNFLLCNKNRANGFSFSFTSPVCSDRLSLFTVDMPLQQYHVRVFTSMYIQWCPGWMCFSYSFRIVHSNLHYALCMSHVWSNSHFQLSFFSASKFIIIRKIWYANANDCIPCARWENAKHFSY